MHGIKLFLCMLLGIFGAGALLTYVAYTIWKSGYDEGFEDAQKIFKTKAD